MSNSGKMIVSRKRTERDSITLTDNVMEEFIGSLVGSVEARKKFSNQLEDKFDASYDTPIGSGVGVTIIRPPFNFGTLAELIIQDDTIMGCIQAICVNAFGFGYTLQYIGKAKGKETSTVALLEQDKLKAFFDNVNENESITDVIRKAGTDKLIFGNSFYELSLNNLGEIVTIYHLPTLNMRLTSFVPGYVDGTMVRGKEIVPIKRQFRLFVQISPNTNKKVYFKEFGDPRVYHKDTGELLEGISQESSLAANAVIHDFNYYPGSFYGVPQYINQLPSILGSKESAWMNYDFFVNNAIPALAILVSGGYLTGDSIDEIYNKFSRKKGLESANRVVVLEATGDEMAASADGKVSPPNVQMKSLVDDRQKDALFSEYAKFCIDQKRSAFRIAPLILGRCHSEDTEYLTKSGWKYAWEVSKDDLLASISYDSGELKFSPYIEKYEYDYDGYLIHGKNRHVDFLVTPNHRMLVRPNAVWYIRKKSWGFVEASKLDSMIGCNGGGCIDVRQASEMYDEGKEESCFVIPATYRVNSVITSDSDLSRNKKRREKSLKKQLSNNCEKHIDMDLFLEFLGYFVSEGSLGRRAAISVHQKKQPHADIMLSCLNKIASHVSVTECKDGTKAMCISHMGLYDYLKDNCGINSKTRKFPDFVLGLSRRQMDIALKALLLGDGSKPKRGQEDSFVLTTTSEELINQVQQISFMLGFSTVVRVDKQSNKKWNTKYYISAVKKPIRLLHKKQITEIPYRGKVYCFSVPEQTLVTRRNGRIIVSGNSSDYNYACYDEETETLTDHGWIKHTDYVEGIKIACYDVVTQKITYQRPIGGIHIYPEPDEMIRILSKDIDIRVTPNHTMLVLEDEYKIKILPAESLLTKETDSSLLVVSSDIDLHPKLISSESIYKEIMKNNSEKVVYCFEVPTHFFVTRRNGKATVQGNTANTAFLVTDSQVFAPARVEVDKLINRKIMPQFTPKYWAYRTSNPRISGNADMVNALKTLDSIGGLTPNMAIRFTNEMFGMDIPQISEDWGNYPFELVKILTQDGTIKGLDKIREVNTVLKDNGVDLQSTAIEDDSEDTSEESTVVDDSSDTQSLDEEQNNEE